MLKVHIDKKNPDQLVVAEGSVMEIANDIALIIHGLYNQWKNQDPTAAAVFRIAIHKVLEDGSPVWEAADGLTGISFRKPE